MPLVSYGGEDSAFITAGGAIQYANCIKVCLGENDFLYGFGCGNSQFVSIAIDIAGFFPATAPLAAVSCVLRAFLHQFAYPDDSSNITNINRALSAIGGIAAEDIGRLYGEVYGTVLNRISQINSAVDIGDNIISLYNECVAPVAAKYFW